MHLACIVKEALPDQIEQFQPTYWASDELFVDEEMSFYKALGGGQVAKKGLLALGSKAVRDNNRRSKAYIAEHGLDSNLSGEGMILGGLIVLRPDEGGIVMQKNESTFGDIAATDEVVAAARAAAYTGDQVPSEAVPPVDTVPTEEPTQEPAPEQEPAQEPEPLATTAAETPAAAVDTAAAAPSEAADAVDTAADAVADAGADIAVAAEATGGGSDGASSAAETVEEPTTAAS